MELSSQEGEIPIPLNSTYGGGHGHGHGHGHMIRHDDPAPHNHIISSSAPQVPSSTGPSLPTNLDDDVPYSFKKVVRYRECLKNHAAAMGGNATDGCGEFIPSGEEGTIEALNCSACNCHRNFHRKEIEGEHSSCDYCYPPLHSPHMSRVGRKVILGHGHHKTVLPPEPLGLGYPTATGTLIHSRATPTPHQMIMSYKMGSLPSESGEQAEDGVGSRPPHGQLMKKRFRSKFSQEQKEKMLNFAEKVGWKIQKIEEGVVQQFCQEIGVKRRVLKVWMHNNKHNLAKKNPSISNATTDPPSDPPAAA